MNQSNIQSNYQVIIKQIRDCATRYQRRPDDIALLAASKRHAAERIYDLLQCGHTAFGENYLQEAVAKMQQLSALIEHGSQSMPPPVWHFIGHIQSRKCREIAHNFDWVHTVENLKTAKLLNQYRQNQPQLKVLIQLNLQQEPSKSGINQLELPQLAAEIQKLPNLDLKGLMIIPQPQPNFDDQRKIFRQCADLLTPFTLENPDINQLSMGMSDDMQAAIAEGATWIRIGTALFGERPA